MNRENGNGAYTKRSVDEDFDTMETQLNALLADLQSNLSTNTHQQQQQQQQSTVITTTQKSSNPNNETETCKRINSSSSQRQENIYQNEDNRSHNQHRQNGIHQETTKRESTDKSSPHVHQSNPSADQMYRHETREEIRTETRSSGPEPSPTTPRAATNNLSELDSLLKDLNTAKSAGMHKTGAPVVNGSRPSVDSLLDELNSVTRTETKQQQDTKYKYGPCYNSNTKQGTPSASNATKELDDLMDSLSDFKGEKKDAKEEVKLNITEDDILMMNTLVRDDVPPPRPPVPATRGHCDEAPPRPPSPDLEEITLPLTLPRPPSPDTGPLLTQSIIYKKLDQQTGPQHNLRHSEHAVDDPIIRPNSGGPVRRNDAEFRWVLDPIKVEVREVIEMPVVEEKINPPTVVNTQYVKPKKRSPSPNQLDSMLGSLTVHMTEQGVTTTQKGCCCACDKPIVGQVITALGKTWHPEHFTCDHCQQELGTKNFFERDGKPYCEPDYHNLFSPKCAYCSGPILDKCVTALDKTWHPEHFFCAHCGNTFGDEGFHEKNGKPYCKEDYFNMFAPKCGGCNSPIMENYISALNGQWHPECFVCRDCHQPFNGGSFFDHEGLPYCETHYHAKRGSLCAGCNKPITGRCITAMFRKYHPEHFVCAFCLQQLNKGTFKEQNDKPYCHPCFDKLYG